MAGLSYYWRWTVETSKMGNLGPWDMYEIVHRQTYVFEDVGKARGITFLGQ